LGGPRGRKITIEDKLCATKLIQEAYRSGCRKTVACKTLGINIRTLERWEKSGVRPDQRNGPINSPKNRLSDDERTQILSLANTGSFAHLPPCQIVPALADQGVYIASESSFYRVLKQNAQLCPRTRQKRPAHVRPKVCVASKPNQVWSWDITYLPSLIEGKFYYLYLFMDIFSRKIVGSDVYESEKAVHASQMIEGICLSENISKNQIVLHSDNGSPMKGATFLTTLRRLGITASYSRPSVSNDNPYSEALFKTLKYCPWYPRRAFSSLESAKHWAKDFANWYNFEHLHSGLKFITPANRHLGLSQNILKKRKEIYEQAMQKNPSRWSRGIRNWDLPKDVYLNPPKQKVV
jgi:putative transposase